MCHVSVSCSSEDLLKGETPPAPQRPREAAQWRFPAAAVQAVRRPRGNRTRLCSHHVEAAVFPAPSRPWAGPPGLTSSPASNATLGKEPQPKPKDPKHLLGGETGWGGLAGRA